MFVEIGPTLLSVEDPVALLALNKGGGVENVAVIVCGHALSENKLPPIFLQINCRQLPTQNAMTSSLTMPCVT